MPHVCLCVLLQVRMEGASWDVSYRSPEESLDASHVMQVLRRFPDAINSISSRSNGTPLLPP